MMNKLKSFSYVLTEEIVELHADAFLAHVIHILADAFQL